MVNINFHRIKNSKLLIPFLVFTLLILVILNYSFIKIPGNNLKNNILGAAYKSPQIYFYNYEDSDNGSSAGGVVSLSSTTSPTIGIGAYNVSGTGEIEIYSSNEDALLDYLAHDDKGKQTKKTPDANKIKYVTTIKKEIKNDKNREGTDVLLPISGKGIWYIKVKLSNIASDAFIVRSDNGTLVKEGDNEFVFWGQNFKSKRSINDGAVILYNLENGRKEIQRSSFDSDGVAKAKLTKDADVALVAIGDDRAIVPLNLQYLNYGYSYIRYEEKTKKSRYFIFTDRPIYKPGDTVNFKAVIRDDDDARYFPATGNANVKIFDGNYYSDSNKLPIYEQNASFSSSGSITGSYKIPENAKTGYFDLVIDTGSSTEGSYYDDYYSSNSVNFMVEFYKKPEFFVDVKSNTEEAIAGDDVSFTIFGNYFSGQPLAKELINYHVRSADYYEYSYLSDAAAFSQSLNDDYRYWYQYDSIEIADGSVDLDKNGKATVKLDSKKTYKDGKVQVFSIDVSTSDKSRTPSFSSKNILVYAGEYGIFRTDYSYGSKVNEEYTLPIKLVAYKDNVDLNGIGLTAKIERHDWNVIQNSNSKYPTYEEVKENLPNLKTKTEGDGEAQFKFTPSKTGRYSITVEGKDTRGNLINKEFYAYFSKEDYPYYSEKGDSDLTLSSDKQKYQPNETAKINIYSYLPNRDIFLNFERGRLDRYKIIHLNGKTGSIELPIIQDDMPNTFVSISSFDDNSLNDNVLKIPVSAESKKIVISLIPDLKKYGPGETVNLNIKTTDTKGNPVSTELAFWAVDKAIFELEINNLGDIFKSFWQERYNNTISSHSLEGIVVDSAEMGGGCFVAGTKVLMANGKTRDIEEVRVGDFVITRSGTSANWIKAKVTKTSSLDEVGYLVINGDLKVTSDHILMLNNSWQTAGSVQIGDKLIDSEGRKVRIYSVEYVKSKAKVYNLGIENYHTFFANNIWVHNEKGLDRTTFKDTAYWNPSVQTNENGEAQVSFKLPDDLTTWTLSAVAASLDTKVGQSTAEITTTKDVIVRPIIPNILRNGDEIKLSAIVQNFTDKNQRFNVSLSFDSGTVEDPNFEDVEIAVGEFKDFIWKVKPNKSNEKAKLIFSAKVIGNDKLADNLTQEIPVWDFGFQEKSVEVGQGDKNFPIKLSEHTENNKTDISLQLSTSLLTTIPVAMKYLINYPYGCVEQTTSRFVPALIAKQNQDLYKDALKDKNIDEIINTGIEKLVSQQSSDGGWSWWGSGDSSPFVSAYVIEYLLKANEMGYEVDENTITRSKKYFESLKKQNSNAKNSDTVTDSDLASANYALVLLGEGKKTFSANFDKLTPDTLSLQVMANYLNGNKNPKTNGLSKLESLAKTQGDSVFWEEGDSGDFGSNDASTALAVKALIMAGGNSSLASKGVRFLVNSRRYDYWDNTFATAQIIAAATDFSKKEETETNFTYNVLLDGVGVSQGSVINSRQIIPEIKIPASKIKDNGSTLSVKKSGKGQIYSTLIIDAFNTNKNEKALNHGIEIKRTYHNAEGKSKLEVGDTALISLTISGLKAGEDYGVIQDELPSGMVPVNEELNNEYNYDDPPDYYSYNWADKEYTKNGVILSLNRVGPGSHTYTYKARVVNEGKFIVPPATSSLMYSPEIYGRTEAETISIPAKVSIFYPPESYNVTNPDSITKSSNVVKIGAYLIGLTFIFMLFALSFLLKDNKKNYYSLKQKIKNKLKKENKTMSKEDQEQQE